MSTPTSPNGQLLGSHKGALLSVKSKMEPTMGNSNAEHSIDSVGQEFPGGGNAKCYAGGHHAGDRSRSMSSRRLTATKDERHRFRASVGGSHGSHRGSRSASPSPHTGGRIVDGGADTARPIKCVNHSEHPRIHYTCGFPLGELPQLYGKVGMVRRVFSNGGSAGAANFVPSGGAVFSDTRELDHDPGQAGQFNPLMHVTPGDARSLGPQAATELPPSNVQDRPISPNRDMVLGSGHLSRGSNHAPRGGSNRVAFVGADPSAVPLVDAGALPTSCPAMGNGTGNILHAVLLSHCVFPQHDICRSILGVSSNRINDLEHVVVQDCANEHVLHNANGLNNQCLQTGSDLWNQSPSEGTPIIG